METAEPSPTSRAIARRASSLIIPLLGAIVVYVASPHGLGLSNDSVRYLRIADVLRGDQQLGTTYPEYMRHFPPGYPALLAAGRFIGLSNVTMGLALNVLAMALTAFLVVRILQRLCYGAIWPGVIGGALLVVSHVTLTMHLQIWSEPAFQVLFLITIAMLARQVDAPTRRRAVLLALVVAASTMVRYAGASLIVLSTVTLLFAQRSTWKNRMIDCAIFSIIAVAPLLLLAVYNQYRTGDAVDREFRYYGLYQVQFREAWMTTATWIFPEHKNPPWRRNWEFLAVIVAFCAVVVSRMRIRRRARARGPYIRPPLPRFVRLALLFCTVYLVILFVSLSFIDPATPLDDRILSPIYLLAIVVGTFGVYRALTLTGAMSAPRAGKIVTGILLAAFVATTAARGYEVFAYSRREGFGYMNWRWRESELMQVIRAIPDSTLVYTNVPDAVYFYTSNPSRLIPTDNPQPWARHSTQSRAQLQDTQRRMSKEGAVIALFYGTADTRFRRGSQSSAELEQTLNARRAVNCDDGMLMIPENASAKVREFVDQASRAVIGARKTQPTTIPRTDQSAQPSTQPSTRKSNKAPRAQ
ncbi:hypothetical protein BH09PLA1_BH09PLA1_16970 [soil metagenome]